MTSRQAATASEVAICATAALDQAEAELANLRAHLASLSVTGDAPGVAYAAARSAQVVEGLTGDVARQLRDLAARQSVAAGS